MIHEEDGEGFPGDGVALVPAFHARQLEAVALPHGEEHLGQEADRSPSGAAMTSRILLPENQLPRQWYNLAADLPRSPLPPLGPGGTPLDPQDLAAVFPMNLIEQEMSQERWIDPFELAPMLKRPLFVPESKHTLDLLRELQRARTQLAIAVDEFGSVSGVVTLEDLLEEVFGEIQEEHEAGEEIRRLPDGDHVVSGGCHVEDLEARLGVSWEHSGFDTVAGLLMARLGRVPKLHEQVDVDGAAMTVLKMDGARVLQVLVRMP